MVARRLSDRSVKCHKMTLHNMTCSQHYSGNALCNSPLTSILSFWETHVHTSAMVICRRGNNIFLPSICSCRNNSDTFCQYPLTFSHSQCGQFSRSVFYVCVTCLASGHWMMQHSISVPLLSDCGAWIPQPAQRLGLRSQASAHGHRHQVWSHQSVSFLNWENKVHVSPWWLGRLAGRRKPWESGPCKYSQCVHFWS